MSEVRVWFEGQPPRKSNQRRIFRNPATGKPMIVKSKAALRWVQGAIAQVTGDKKVGIGSEKAPLRILFFVFYKDRRPDLSVELVLDTLEKAGVISNDRHVYDYQAYKLFSKTLQGVYCIIRETYPENCYVELSKWVGVGDDKLDKIAIEAFPKEKGE